MKLVIIAAVSVDGVIGIGNEIPWKIPEDFKHYRETTMGHTLICGSKTFKNLPQKAHEGRRFCVLTSKGIDENLDKDKYFDFENVKDLFDVIEPINETYYVIGGESVYEQLIDYCDEAVITWVNKMYLNGDKKFPIEKLFANFEIVNDNSWEKSRAGLSYKITHYKKI